jgi:hypothetical protein
VVSRWWSSWYKDIVPELDGIVLNLLNLDWTGNLVGDHLFNVHLELAHILPWLLAFLVYSVWVAVGKISNRHVRFDANFGKTYSPSLYSGGWPTTPWQLSGSSWPSFFAVTYVLPLAGSHRLTDKLYKFDEIGGGEAAEENVVEG